MFISKICDIFLQYFSTVQYHLTGKSLSGLKPAKELPFGDWPFMLDISLLSHYKLEITFLYIFV